MREALLQLKADKLVDGHPRPGLCVAPLVFAQAHELYVAIGLIESSALGLAGAPDEDVLDRLGELTEQREAAQRDPGATSSSTPFGMGRCSATAPTLSSCRFSSSSRSAFSGTRSRTCPSRSASGSPSVTIGKSWSPRPRTEWPRRVGGPQTPLDPSRVPDGPRDPWRSPGSVDR